MTNENSNHYSERDSSSGCSSKYDALKEKLKLLDREDNREYREFCKDLQSETVNDIRREYLTNGVISGSMI